MRSIKSGPTLAALFVLALVLAGAPMAPAGEPSSEVAAPAAAVTDSTPCDSALVDLLGMTPAVSSVEAPGSAAALLGPLPQVLQPHCCSQFEVDACRSGCKAQGPGCKGQIGCRAGECVCTCTCP
jgi:hypothetical protein